ncbi:uncharacterized protein LY79DRAFT_76249 [Colletotrichum navitas]|uniref:Uncharacterized protein n=1 Tax=Colletotrichum navitas TaxID=681940 RepID=A0AAD8V927_9PEZI|nr:uncharacterized protein LY79DRAFT_76249 [Colletotrichum navitas]KAK1596045.1 hypothetical protein LY79DRAFT_76249 [Colletotrichum navitas]
MGSLHPFHVVARAAAFRRWRAATWSENHRCVYGKDMMEKHAPGKVIAAEGQQGVVAQNAQQTHNWLRRKACASAMPLVLRCCNADKPKRTTQGNGHLSRGRLVPSKSLDACDCGLGSRQRGRRTSKLCCPDGVNWCNGVGLRLLIERGHA